MELTFFYCNIWCNLPVEEIGRDEDIDEAHDWFHGICIDLLINMMERCKRCPTINDRVHSKERVEAKWIKSREVGP